MISKAKAIYRFDMSVGDPIPDEAATARDSYNSQVTGAKAIDHTLQGVLFYYPHEGGQESTPMKYEFSGAGVKAEYGQGSEDEEDQRKSSRVDRDHIAIDVFWAERLIPQVLSSPSFSREISSDK